MQAPAAMWFQSVSACGREGAFCFHAFRFVDLPRLRLPGRPLISERDHHRRHMNDMNTHAKITLQIGDRAAGFYAFATADKRARECVGGACWVQRAKHPRLVEPLGRGPYRIKKLSYHQCMPTRALLSTLNLNTAGSFQASRQ